MDLINYYKNSIKLFFFRDENFDEINKEEFSSVAIGYLLLNTCLFIISNIIMFYNTNSEKSKIYLVLINTISQLITITIATLISFGILHLILKLFKATKKYVETLKFGISFSIFATILMGIINLIIQIIYRNALEIPFNTVNTIIFSLYCLIFLGMFIWMLIIFVKYFAKLHEISKANVVWSIIITAIIGIILLGITIIILYLTQPVVVQ